MIGKTLSTIKNAISGERAYNLVREISNFHRIQASTGYRAAAQHVMNRLEQDGLDVRIRSYPADGKTWFFTSKMFKEWNCRDAALTLVSPERHLADFKSNNMSIIQRSYPCDFRDQPLEIVMLDRGSDPAAYDGLDLHGKLIFVREHFQGFVDWAVRERGAVGIITDFMRTTEQRARYDLYDICNYTSFWWKHTEGEPKTFGFVLTPRQGDQLAQLCSQMAQEHEKDPSKDAYPEAVGFVDAELYDGAIEVVEAVLPGQADEEVLIVSHLCHPRASANDNASGVAACMEVARVLHDLTTAGELAPLKRSIRVIFVPEFTGTYAYLNDRGDEMKKIMAGINLDMVGGRQSHGYGPLTISGLPHSSPSFVVDLAALVLDEVRKNVPSQTFGNYISMFNTAVVDLETGSDHLVLSDPTINIPSVMLGQWPDFNYHTSGDTMEVIDPFILHKSASICAGFIYTLANLTQADAALVMNKSRERFVGDLAKLVHSAVEQESDPGLVFEKFKHYTDFYKACNQTFPHFFSGPDHAAVTGQVEQENAFLDNLSTAMWDRYRQDYAPGFEYAPAEVPEMYRYIPLRTFAAPLSHVDDYALGNEQKMAAYKAFHKDWAAKIFSDHYLDSTVQFYIDGKRSLWEIARQATLETRDGSVEYVHDYVQLLQTLGLVEIAGKVEN